MPTLSAIGNHVVEWRTAAGLLQARDTGVTGVISEYDDDLLVKHDRGGQLVIKHEITAVTDDDDHFAFRPGHLDPHPASDFIAHARITVFHVITARRTGTPELVEFGRQGAGGTH